MKIRYFVTTCSLAVVAALVAAPMAASASTIADGQELYGYQSGLYTVNSVDASVGLIGAATGLNSVYGADYSDVDGVAYFFYDGDPCEFYSVDITSGVTTDLGPIVDGVTNVDNCDALDVAADGTVYLGSYDVVYEISTTDGSATAAHTVTGDTPDSDIAWLATDPTSAILYMGDYSGNLFSLDTTTWASTFIIGGLPYIESGDFDANGTFWFSGDGPDAQGLSSFVLSDPLDVTTYGDFIDSSESTVSLYAIFVAGEAVVKPEAPVLAATGQNTTAILGAGVAALLLVAAGGLLVGRRRHS